MKTTDHFKKLFANSLLILFLSLPILSQAQLDSIFLIKKDTVVGKIKYYNDSSVFYKAIDGSKKEIPTNKVAYIVFRQGYEVIFKDGKAIQEGYKYGNGSFYDYKKSVPEKIDLAGIHLKKAKNYFIGTAITSVISLAGFSYNLLSRPDTSGLFSNPLKYAERINDWESRKRTAAIVGTGAGAISIVLFLIGNVELKKASAYLTNELDLPITLNLKPNQLSVAFRF